MPNFLLEWLMLPKIIFDQNIVCSVTMRKRDILAWDKLYQYNDNKIYMIKFTI